MPAIDIDRESAQEAAQRELARPIYPRSSLSDRIAEWVNDLLYRLVVNGSSVPGGWFTIVVLALLTLVAVVVAVRIARRTMGSRSGSQLFGTRNLSASDHRARAEQAAAQGDWATAIRQRVRAIGRQLEENGVMNPVPGRTAGELAAYAGAVLPDLAADLAAAADTFNDVTYGERPGAEPNYRRVSDLDDRLRRLPSATAASTVAGRAGR